MHSRPLSVFAGTNFTHRNVIIDDSGGPATAGAPHFFTAPAISEGSDVQYAVVESEDSPNHVTTTITSSSPVTEHDDNVVLVYHSMTADGTTTTETNGHSMLILNEEEDACFDPTGGSLLSEQPQTASDNSGDMSTSEQQPLYLGRLVHKEQYLLIQEPCIDIGRNSTKSNVHFHVSKNSFISRKHLQLTFQPSTGDFYLICLSKNGIFVDKSFFRNLHEPIKLHQS